jgi:hypothetical protein
MRIFSCNMLDTSTDFISQIISFFHSTYSFPHSLGHLVICMSPSFQSMTGLCVYNQVCPMCKGTSICFLTSPTLTLNPPCSYIYPQHLCTIPRDHTYSLTTLISRSPTTHQMLTHQRSLTFHLSLCSYLRSTG